MNESTLHSGTLTIPVLFMVFNRLDTTKKVFEAIRRAKPPRLYIGADGARESKENEAEKVEEVREFLLSSVDWDCQVKTLFRDKNLGSRVAVSGAIDWFLQEEEMGVILEDDCLPCQSFFYYCQELLEKYKTDPRIMCISGNNFKPGAFDIGYSYFFSEIPLTWGWATWRRAWSLFKFAEPLFFELQPKNVLLSHYAKASKMWWNKVSRTLDKEFDAWDYLWTFTNLINSGLTIIPTNNLIKNIGIGHFQASNTKRIDKRYIVETSDLDFPLNHPPLMKINFKADKFFYRNNFNVNPIWRRVIRKLQTLY